MVQIHKRFAAIPKLYMATYTATIRRSSFEVLFGVKMRNPEYKNMAEVVANEIINAFSDERDEMRAEIRSNIEHAQEEQKQTYCKKRKLSTKYKINDVVAIKRTQFGAGLKINAKYLGPYKVEEIMLNDRYRVEKVGEHEGPKSTTTAADFMKVWRSKPVYIVSSDESDGEGK